jgi:HAMP domain-containing protein
MQFHRRLAIFGFAILAAIALVAWFSLHPTNAILQTYHNSTYRFSLMMPADFTANEITDSNASTTILLQNRSGDGVQILILPWDEPAGALTPERITKSTGLPVNNAQPIKINGATGLTFKSDNSAFDGATSEGWFTYGGNVYEISTYARNDALLKSMLASWTF